MAPNIRVAACHVSPIFLDCMATAQKCMELIREAARNGANLVVFPESYIPAFPLWSSCITPAENHAYFVRMVEESLYADGEVLAAIRIVAKQYSIAISIGFSEKVRYSSATLFNSNIIIGIDGSILAHHRKLVPTFFEKLTWAPGDGNGLKVVDIPSTAGTEGQEARTVKVGVLICGENTNPLARYSLMAQGEQIHITTWPAKWPTRMVHEPVENNPTEPEHGNNASATTHGKYDNVSANRTRAAAHSFEAKCFSIVCSGFMSGAIVDDLVLNAPDYMKNVVSETIRHSTQAESLFIDPSGSVLPGFTIGRDGQRKEVTSLQYEEGILYADLDMGATIEGKQFHDVVGGYQRLDVFELKVDTTRRNPVTFREMSEMQSQKS
ncbi:nitrilase [Pseudomassariella vexata]|uniref:Nitrilase n=1 Tax=Pseudomassariella vexata TaxID=1141098 RepID=A0A1Y2E6P6_9PEZI|nr:nitrilase [Pseudomassariella vexata]ORY67231.1 nitrilase [Pseudomassariella vexata]